MMAENTKENLPAVPTMKLELVPVPVSDVDRAKAFYVEKAGFKLEVDTRPTDTMRVVQLTPPGSACTIVFGTGMGDISAMQPGSVKGLHLVVADLREAREALVKRGLEVGEVWDVKGVKYAGFSDPDGNLWLMSIYAADQPLSTARIAPLTLLESSEARKAMADAICSGLATPPDAEPCTIANTFCSPASWAIEPPSPIAVSTPPGQTALQRIP